jgi:cystathionine beta-lyase/cystathionine gamma-synthase
VYLARKVFGAMPDPDLASRLERSLKTLPLRVAAANRNALALAQRLEAHPAIERVFYPGLERHPGHDLAKRQMTLGFGPLLAIAIRGGDAAAVTFVDALRLVRLAASLGSVESLASVPARMSHVQLDAAGLAEAGIPPGLVRLSIGIEDEADLWADLEQALHQAAAVRA